MAVKGRERASRRAVKQAVDEAEAEARAQQVAAQLVSWYNQQVGVSLLQYARLGRGRRIHILDTTHVEVPLETGTYECSGGQKRGRDAVARLQIGHVADATGQRRAADASGAVGDPGARYVLVPSLAGGGAGVARWGFLALEDRGFLDGATVSHPQRQRQVDVIIPLKANMLATQEAIQLAAMADQWEAHPSRAEQRIAWVHGVEHMWPECAVPLDACVIRFCE